MIERDKEFSKAIDEIAKGIEKVIKKTQGQSSNKGRDKKN